jgi:hypothetical protein
MGSGKTQKERRALMDAEGIKKLYEQHVGRYAGRIEAAKHGATHVRVSECEYYLGLWEGMKAKGFDSSKFTREERMELNDAIEDEGA